MPSSVAAVTLRGAVMLPQVNSVATLYIGRFTSVGGVVFQKSFAGRFNEAERLQAGMPLRTVCAKSSLHDTKLR